jgi:hypothetical protein
VETDEKVRLSDKRKSKKASFKVVIPKKKEKKNESLKFSKAYTQVEPSSV